MNMRQICHRALTLIVAMALSGCGALPRQPANPTPTATTASPPTAAGPCTWTWATGPGSAAFESAVRQALAAAAMTGTVRTSSYGEKNSCDGSFHAMALDVVLEVEVADLGDEAGLAAAAAGLDNIIAAAMSASEVPNRGKTTITFVSADRASNCVWAPESGRCRP